MSFCEQLSAFLTKEGFQPEATEFGLQFKFQGLEFVHFKDDNDALFLNLFFPQIFPVTPENKADVLEAINTADNDVKLAKGAIRFGNAVWVGTECALSEGFDLKAIVPRCVNAMLYYRDTFYRAYSQTPSGQEEVKKAQEAHGEQQA